MPSDKLDEQRIGGEGFWNTDTPSNVEEALRLLRFGVVFEPIRSRCSDSGGIDRDRTEARMLACANFFDKLHPESALPETGSIEDVREKLRKSIEREQELEAKLASKTRDADHFFQLSGRYLEELNALQSARALSYDEAERKLATLCATTAPGLLVNVLKGELLAAWTNADSARSTIQEPYCWLDAERGIVHYSKSRADMMAGFGDKLIPLYKLDIHATATGLPPEANELATMARDARRYREVKACDWIGLRVADQEFIGVSNLDAWADARSKVQSATGARS